MAVHFAREGADVAILYLNEDKDAQDTKKMVEKEGRKCVIIAGDVGEEEFCKGAVQRAVKELGKLDILVNNAGVFPVMEMIENFPTDAFDYMVAETVMGYETMKN